MMLRGQGLLIALVIAALSVWGCQKEAPSKGEPKNSSAAKGSKPAESDAGNTKAPAGKAGDDAKAEAKAGTPALDNKAATPPKPSTAAAPAATASKPLLLELEAAKYLPADTVGVVAVRNVRTWLTWAGALALRDAFAPIAKRVSEEMVRDAGYDFFDLATYAKMGIDLDAPAGFALLKLGKDEEEVAAAGFFSLKQRDVASAALRNLAGRARVELREERFADAVVFYAADKRDPIRVVLFEKLAMVIFHIDRTPLVAETARNIAVMQPDASLAMSARFKEHAALTKSHQDLASYYPGT